MVDLLKADLLPPIPRALLSGYDRDLLAPLHFLVPGEPLQLRPATVDRSVDRSSLAASLVVFNEGLGHPEGGTLGSLLADPETLVVVTGQQPGLFGGPLYGLSKAIAAAKWAERLRAEGRQAVAVFWIASEDHDFREVSRVVVPHGADTHEISLGPDPEPLVPVGQRCLSEAIDGAREKLYELIGQHDGKTVELIDSIYQPGTTFTEAFGKFLIGALGDRCPLLLDALNPAVKEAQAPGLLELVEKRAEVDTALAAQDRRLEERGYKLQVRPQPSAAPLFLLENRSRRRIEWVGEDRFQLRGSETPPEPIARLREFLAQEPQRVSAGVLARPLIQDLILGTSLQVLGPGEVSYMPQAAALYPLLDVEPPRVTLRPQILVLEEKRRQHLVDLDLPLEELVRETFDLDGFLARRAGVDFLPPIRESMDKLLGKLKEQAAEVDTNLSAPWEKTRNMIHGALEKFSGKLAAAAARHNQVDRKRIQELRLACRPAGELQERVIAGAYFPLKFGTPFVDAVWEQMDVGVQGLQLIRLAAGAPSSQGGE